MGTGTVTEGTTVSIVMPFTPKLVVIFPFTQVAWRIGDYNNSYLSEYGFLQWFNVGRAGGTDYFYNNVLQYAVWYEGLTNSPLETSPDPNFINAWYGAELVYSVNGTTLSWKVTKPISAYKFARTTADRIYNASQTYHYIAIG